MAGIKVLIADDEKNTRNGISLALDENRYVIDQAEDGKEALDKFKTSMHPIVITDLKMPNMTGMQLLDEIKKIAPETIVMIITAFGDMETAVEAMKKGAYDFVAKPFDADQIEVKVNKAAERLILMQDNQNLREQLKSEVELIGESEVMRRLKDNILMVAETNESVLITGPNGTGKELIAKAIQKNSNRVDKPFIKVNSAAIPETLIESELFGIKKGSFTGAVEDKQGKFQQADKGTIFLDEVGDMSLATQAKILRVLETGEIEEVGGNNTTRVDVRVLAATNQDLPVLIREKKFREDLFFRLNVFPIVSPPLSQRKNDIPLLIEYFIENMGGVSNIEQVFLPEAVTYLKSLAWPGNVRELRNIVKRALLFCKQGPISLEKIKELVNPSFQMSASSSSTTGGVLELDTSKPFKQACDHYEKKHIIKVLEENDGNVSAASKQLGLQRSYLHTKMKILGIK